MFKQLNRMLAVPCMMCVRCYQYTLRGTLGNACRFYPSCSDYSLQAFKRFGCCMGTLLTVWRLFRCQPYSQSGFDPIYNKKNSLHSMRAYFLKK